ncbi:MAG TPA: 3-isopropylmalate dehydrogenase [Pseudonocardia sp.]|nr:3-isopropylmalate dehydrogenase [Pseudonocardia sp.]
MPIPGLRIYRRSQRMAAQSPTRAGMSGSRCARIGPNGSTTPVLVDRRSMSRHSLLLLPGDGIGPEVLAEVDKLTSWCASTGIADFDTVTDLVGGSCYDVHGVSITDETMAVAAGVDAVLFGAVGGPKWDGVPYEVRPEAGLLRLRKELDLFANLRPALCYPALADASSLKRELVEGLDIMIVRELTGGVYFGEPKEIVTLESGERRAVDTQVYSTGEIERIARVAFELAGKRRGLVTSTEKHNVMRTGVLWRQVVTAVHQAEFPDLTLQHALADSFAMQLVRRPRQFDVVVSDNLFGDMLSDIAATLTGSLGMLPSASLGALDAETGMRKALYEPVHGSAPDIAGQGMANPLAMLGSFGMALRYSFGLGDAADLIDQAVAQVLADGLRTPDLGEANTDTAGMGDAVLAALKRLS